MPLVERTTLLEQSQRILAALSQRREVTREATFDFRRGQSLLDPYSILPNQVEKANNLIIWRDGRLRRRKGFTRWGSNQIGAPSAVTSLFQFIKADATKFFLASAANGSVWKDAGSGGAWTSVVTGLTAAAGADWRPSWRTFANLAVMVDGENAVQKYNGTTWAALGGVNADTNLATVVEPYQGRLWLGAEPGNGSRVRYSDVSNGESYPANNFLDISINDGEDITASLMVQNTLFYSKRSRLFVVLGDSPTTYGWLPRSRPGFVARDSIQVIEGGALGLSDDGVYHFDTLTMRKVSWELDPLFDRSSPGLNLARLKYAQARYYPTLRQYHLLVSSVGSSVHNRLYIGHVDLMWEDENGRRHLPFTESTTFSQNTLGLILGADNTYELFSGDSAGKAYRQDDGTTDDGAAIPWDLWTRQMGWGDVTRLKMLEYADMILDDISSGSMTVTPRMDFGLISGSAITVNLDGGNDPHQKTISLPGQAQLLQLRMNGSTDFGIRGCSSSARLTTGKL